jgi:hypothetical protein
MSSSELYKQTLLETAAYKGIPVEYTRGTERLAIIIDPRYDELMEAVIEFIAKRTLINLLILKKIHL